MKDLSGLFDFPQKYRVNRIIEPKDYLKRANLTQREKEELSILSKVEILYDLHFPDGSESIVIGVSLKYMRNKFSVQNIARIIATSIPYLSVVVVRVGDIIKVAMLKSKPNQYDLGRRVVKEYTCSDEICLNEILVSASDTIKQISNSYYHSSSSEEFNVKLSEIAASIKEDRKTKNDIIEKDYRRWRVEIKKQADDFSRFITAVYDDKFDYEDVPFTTDVSYERSYIEDFGNLGYGLYKDFSESYDIPSVYDWLAFYINTCSEYARELDMIRLSKSEIKKIVSIMSKEEDYRDNGYYGERIDAENFKDYINEEIEFMDLEFFDEFDDDE